MDPTDVPPERRAELVKALVDRLPEMVAAVRLLLPVLRAAAPFDPKAAAFVREGEYYDALFTHLEAGGKPCPACRGKYAPDVPCPTCGGTGKG